MSEEHMIEGALAALSVVQRRRVEFMVRGRIARVAARFEPRTGGICERVAALCDRVVDGDEPEIREWVRARSVAWQAAIAPDAGRSVVLSARAAAFVAMADFPAGAALAISTLEISPVAFLTLDAIEAGLYAPA